MTSTAAAPEAATAPSSTRWATILAVGFAQLVVAGGMSSLAVGLPPIRTEFAVSEAATAWVLLAYALPMGAVAIAAGRLADRADLRAVAVFSMSALMIGSVAAALAPTFPLLLAARAVGGLLGGLLFGMTGRIIVTSAAAHQRGRAMSVIALLMTIGGMGMVGAGGLIIAAFDWRGLFWVFTALSAVAVAALAMAVPSNGTGLPRPDRPLLVDIATSGGAIAAFLLAFEYLDSAPWVSLGVLAVSAALATVWVRQPSSGPTVALLRSPVMAGALLSLTLLSAVTGLLNFSIPFLMTDVHRVRPELVSMVMLTFIGGVGAMTPLAGWLADRFGPGRVSLGGAGLVVVAIVPLLFVDGETGLVDLGSRIALLGLAFGIFNTPMNTHLLASAPAEQSGTAGAFMATTRTVGTSLGPVVAALMWGLGATALDGYRMSAWAIAGILVLGAALQLTTKPWRTPVPAAA
ncbi:MFS transporter [Glycomyces harbinensis]|uniref:Predicted arabinose efflux permease, MFS family n=1 Tax=Glycomyces harbinensis TaxID=58114 RepID=A0A1G6VR08_9ACTN|nr:MFS transporter [Glycomyces harbinensis]SDD56018.1 Predicted arabinose efflux permease, MFS family [Glycomyces harbinensis]